MTSWPKARIVARLKVKKAVRWFASGHVGASPHCHEARPSGRDICTCEGRDGLKQTLHPVALDIADALLDLPLRRAAIRARPEVRSLGEKAEPKVLHFLPGDHLGNCDVGFGRGVPFRAQSTCPIASSRSWCSALKRLKKDAESLELAAM